VTCVFCGSTVSKTDEHVYAKWMRRGLQAEAPTTVTVGRENRFIRTDAGTTVVLHQGVCLKCNTGWMSALERRVQPLLLPAMTGQRMAWMPESQRDIAVWSVQKALLSSLAMRELGFSSFAPASTIHWLYEHRGEGLPPPGTQVWLAAVEAHLGTSDALTGSITTGWAPPSPREPRFYFVTFSAGCLAIQVAGPVRGREKVPAGGQKPGTSTWPLTGEDVDALGSAVVRFLRTDSLLTTVVSIWPARTEPVMWPPGRVLTREVLTDLGEWEGTESEVVRQRGTGHHE
jgi:hypothetical protein